MCFSKSKRVFKQIAPHNVSTFSQVKMLCCQMRRWMCSCPRFEGCNGKLSNILLRSSRNCQKETLSSYHVKVMKEESLEKIWKNPSRCMNLSTQTGRAPRSLSSSAVQRSIGVATAMVGPWSLAMVVEICRAVGLGWCDVHGGFVWMVRKGRPNPMDLRWIWDWMLHMKNYKLHRTGVLHLISWFLDDDGVDANLQNASGGHTSSLQYCPRVELKRFQHWQNIILYFDFLVYSTLREETNTLVEVHDISHSGCSQHLNFKYDSIGHVIELGHQRNWQESADGSPDSSRSPGTSPSAKCEIVRCGTPAVTSVAHTPRIESSWNEGCSRIPKVCKRLI